ncbi:phosphatase PAP2 family protein [Aquimarina agarivorans]|uniref:phosphatase PAP2 family protein n=1 Tax=Aquimarina agarivorans TaxID=980584 RepID=UPI0002D795F0|nr:phosphatase PAP2 family protein [Aquimarina agarivorans]
MLKRISELDTELLIFLNNLGTTTWDTFWLTYTEKITHIPLMLIALVLLFKVLGKKKFFLSLLFIAVMVTFTDQLTNLAKDGFQRPRPCKVPELEESLRYIAKYCSRFGFFSGHSSNSMALAVFIGSLLKPKYPKFFIFLIIWAFGMGYSRVYIGVHYPGDLLVGFSVGTLVALLLYKLFPVVVSKLKLSDD